MWIELPSAVDNATVTAAGSRPNRAIKSAAVRRSDPVCTAKAMYLVINVAIGV
jgi:hypothetical protein